MYKRLKPKKKITDQLGMVIRESRPIWQNFVPAGRLEQLVTEEEFRNTPVPEKDVLIPNMNFVHLLDGRTLPDANLFGLNGRLNTYMDKIGLDMNSRRISNCGMYPNMSRMKWHTNSNHKGKRIYYSYSAGKAIFARVDEKGKVIFDVDKPGWNARQFDIGGPDNLFWHSIWTEKARFTFGFAF